MLLFYICVNQLCLKLGVEVVAGLVGGIEVVVHPGVSSVQHALLVIYAPWLELILQLAEIGGYGDNQRGVHGPGRT